MIIIYYQIRQKSDAKICFKKMPFPLNVELMVLFHPAKIQLWVLSIPNQSYRNRTKLPYYTNIIINIRIYDR